MSVRSAWLRVERERRRLLPSLERYAEYRAGLRRGRASSTATSGGGPYRAAARCRKGTAFIPTGPPVGSERLLPFSILLTCRGVVASAKKRIGGALDAHSASVLPRCLVRPTLHTVGASNQRKHCVAC